MLKKKKQTTWTTVPPEARRTVTLVTRRAMFRRVTLCCRDTLGWARVARNWHFMTEECMTSRDSRPPSGSRTARCWSTQRRWTECKRRNSNSHLRSTAWCWTTGTRRRGSEPEEKRRAGWGVKDSMKWMKNYLINSPLRKAVACKIWQARRWCWDRKCASWKGREGKWWHCPKLSWLCVCVCVLTWNSAPGDWAPSGSHSGPCRSSPHWGHCSHKREGFHADQKHHIKLFFIVYRALLQQMERKLKIMEKV